MPRQTIQRMPKPPNGQASSGTYLLTFDLDDPAEQRAWETAQQLASQRRLKHVLTGLLLAVGTVQEHTGRQVDMLEFTAQFITAMVRGGSYSQIPLSVDTDPGELPTAFIGTADHADPLEARQAFAGGMGDLFADDDDDWDR